ncbi:MAG: cysteine desulfurase [Telmatospirillum sp.]|nr:cysteine desulfurase [Telmatospirillum sp.]
MALAAAYLDYNATAPIRPEARAAVLDALAEPGNPSSVHGFGRRARRLVEDARDHVAALAGARPEGVIFTSGGTESNALALAGWGRPVLVSAIEHPSVLKAGRGDPIAVGADGRVDPVQVAEILSRRETPPLVAVMLVNNETGVIQPVAEIARIAHDHGALVHCDAVQAAGRIPLDIGALGVDSLSLSGHKLGAPTGVGALVLADPDGPLAPMVRGGGQERSRRPGTENLPGIAGFGAAAGAVLGEQGEETRLSRLRNRLEDGARTMVSSAVVMGADAPRVGNTCCLAIPGVAAQTLLMGLDLAGVAVSSGSACSSGRVAASHVLEAMGAGDLARQAIRISLGWASTDLDVDRFLEAFGTLAGRLCRPAALAG